MADGRQSGRLLSRCYLLVKCGRDRTSAARPDDRKRASRKRISVVAGSTVSDLGLLLVAALHRRGGSQGGAWLDGGGAASKEWIRRKGASLGDNGAALNYIEGADLGRSCSSALSIDRQRG